jgi:hypothetical protein
MTQFIKKLPAVFQTVTEKKFFDATFDQVFSKKDSDLLYGYIGRRKPGSYNPISDFYVPEPTKDRAWWQLEATAFSRNADYTKSNVVFYDDLLNRINYQGGNTLNQDRLFESEYYSWSPPIDPDMFMNYHNYYWVESRLATINITGVLGTDITGQSAYTTPSTATPPNLTLTTGMSIMLVNDPLYTAAVTVENIGGCVGIRLVPQFPDYTAGTVLEFLPWDGILELASGRVIRNTNWDITSWETQPQPGNADYITIERGAVDRNAWSRTNKWYHIDAINASISASSTPFPINALRALRPIIQFSADLILYKSGTQFRTDLSYGFNNNLFGNAILLADFQGMKSDELNNDYSINLVTGNLVCFFQDASANQTIYEVTVDVTDTVTLTGVAPLVIDGDIVFTTSTAPYNGAVRGQTWYFNQGDWNEAVNDKVSVNQPPLFQLYDHNGINLDNNTTYPSSTFSGSKLFSYKINAESGATPDAVLKFPIVYTSLGQASDIVFQNNLMTDRYTYSNADIPIKGYYYYVIDSNPVLFNNWNLYAPCDCADIMPPPPANCVSTSKQRVVDKFVVGYGSEYQFKLSVTPYGYPASPDIVVSVNGIEIKNAIDQLTGYTFVSINNRLFINLENYISNLLIITQSVPPVVEITTYTHDLLDPAATGYFNIPQELDANPLQDEIFEISASNLFQQFTSIIENQIGFTGVAFGGNSNNYRDSLKNKTVGAYILQNVAPALKSMLVSSSADLDIIASIRFSSDEYTKFKNKFLRSALLLINQEFNPVQYHNNTVVVSAWVDEILKTVNISKEFSDAFAYSYMIANGSTVLTEAIVVPANGLVALSNYINLADDRNALYMYDVSGLERLLLIGTDYEIVSTNLSIDLQFNTATVPAGTNISAAFYKNPVPAYIPSTPTKVGAYNVFIPRIELDTSYATPVNVIIGHDGSKTIAYNDYRDQLLLELEKRIYNLLKFKFRNEYHIPLRIEAVKSGYFRQTRYSRNEYLAITNQYLNKWSAMNKANYRVNDWVSASEDLPLNSPELWKLYNYSSAVTPLGEHLNLPGHWKGVFQFYYDTINPDTRPWEMLGFSAQPTWWNTEYGTDWSSTNVLMWADLEAGLIRQGPSAIYDPVTLLPQVQPMWARPGLSLIIPVDSLGQIIPVPVLFNVAMTANMYEPFDGFDDNWGYGDGSPVEQAWLSTSGYAFSVQEFLYLMKPAKFGELLWDTVGTEMVPGTLMVPGVYGPVMSTANWQYVQNDTYANDNEYFEWMRPKNAGQNVHAEIADSAVIIRYGYQRWISDRIMFLGKNVADTFGQKIRTLDVNLANKLAGFTNKDTMSAYVESASTNSGTTGLLIPTNNFSVLLHTGQPIKTYSYSGVIVRALENGMFVVYGYDLLHSEFKVLNRSDAQVINITIGGTPEEFKVFMSGETYYAGDIVRYNGVFYQSLVTQAVTKFDSTAWQKLKSLPTSGGISVDYKPLSKSSFVTVPYGSVLRTVQEVFDLLIGWGAYLETQGWQFTDVSTDTNQISNWEYSAKQFLFWVNSSWSPDSSIQLSPGANNAMLTVATGYPGDVESISNGIYSILDKFGVAIPPSSTSTDRDGKSIAVSPTDLASGGIYFLQVNATETEHIIIFDNTTSFSDIIYSPLLRARQQRLRFNGFRSNGWYGKMEAPGYLIINDQLVPNYDTIVSAMRYYYDPDVTIDNPSLEDLGRHLIGYESKSYLDNLQVSNDVQYLFYQGAIRQKGTIQAFDKLFRSTKVQSNDVIEVYEEWALKLGDFGNTIEQVSTEFKLVPELNSGEVIVARLNFLPSSVGFVKQINILNAENIYTFVPKLVISAPDAVDTIPPSNRQASAYVVLNSAGVISRVDITDKGHGYTTAPVVLINSSELHQLDKLYAVWQGVISRDIALDNIVEIDIDDTDAWVVRPQDPGYSLEFPTTANIEYNMPNAGYVNFNDIDWTSFGVTQTAIGWGSAILNPINGNTVWIAKTFTEDWGVYKMTSVNAPERTWSVIEDAAANLVLRTNLAFTISPQYVTTTGVSTDFGNMICLQIVNNGIVEPNTNYAVAFSFSSADLVYNYYSLLTLDGLPITADDVGVYPEFTDLLMFNTLRFDVPPMLNLPTYIGLGDYVWIDNVDDKWGVFTINGTPGYWDINIYDPAIGKYWGNQAGYDVSGPLYLTPYRVQEPLINTSLFESAEVFHASSKDELVLLPIYDPFKSILPALAKQNISYMLLQDPAKYNVTGDNRLYSENIVFSDSQVGKLWWDLSEVRYAYYEQPIALDGSESATDNIVYRRDYWGQIFPGSTINIYEWTKSVVPPDAYTGTGTPRSTSDYVQLISYNRFTNVSSTNYYFWVLNPTTTPNANNRTLPALSVSRLLTTPKSLGFTFFAPIQQTLGNNSYMLYNVQDILTYKGNNVQIKYRLGERNDQPHTQWQFFREGDPGSLVTNQYWDKMVDSLCGYTKVLPSSDEWLNSIFIAGYLPWDIYGWDIAPYDDATTTTTPIYGEILPVPDPSLTEGEKYGIMYRPRQGMFVDLYAARKVFVQSANNLLKHIPIRDNNPTWSANVISDTYWKYTNWYALGYEDAIPTVVFSTLALATTALANGTIANGSIVEITNGTVDGRFVLYVAMQLNPNIAVLSFQKIGIELSAVELLNTVYTTKGVYGLSLELRGLLNAMRTVIFVDNFVVDQNEMYFSLLNYVLSEQKTPDWLFKTSYIYIKENNIPLAQTTLYKPDQIGNIIDYITDAKPYHTQIRDYTSTYLASDIAIGTASDVMKSKTTLKFGPYYSANYHRPVITLDALHGWDLNQGQFTEAWDTFLWDADNDIDGNLLTMNDVIEQYVSGNPVLPAYNPVTGSWPDLIPVELSMPDASKVGLSALFPYTFDFLGTNLVNPQSFITPASIILVKVGLVTLKAGIDFYAGYNDEDETYTVYFYTDPGAVEIPVAYVLWNGGSLMNLQFDSNRNELALGYAIDDFVVNVDTQLYVNNTDNSYTAFTDMWDFSDAIINDIIANIPGNTTPEVRGFDMGAWDQDTLDYSVVVPGIPTISFKENLNANTGANFYRNTDANTGVLSIELPAPDAISENLDVIHVTATAQVLPTPTYIHPGVIWINGERIEYLEKVANGYGNWLLKLVRRGTMGTAPTLHPQSSIVRIENKNILLGAPNTAVWNAINTLPSILSGVYEYSDVQSVPLGGLWYAQTPEAVFLKTELGKAVP